MYHHVFYDIYLINCGMFASAQLHQGGIHVFYYLIKGIISSLLLSCLLLIVYPDLYVYFMCLYLIFFLTITQ